MDSNSRTWAWIVLAIVVVAAVVWWLYAQTSPTPVPATTSSAGEATQYNNTTGNTTAPAPVPATVTYDGTSFSPAQITVAVGGAVTFANQSSRGMWVASAPHPTHEGYSGTTRARHCPDTAGVAFDQCATGASYSFTFQKAGTWKYHNHLNPSAYGTVVVTAQ